MAWLLGATAALALGLPTLIVLNTPRTEPKPPARAAARARPAPPRVEPLRYAPLTPVQAVAANAAVPFSTAPNPAARPFHAPETGAARDRAVDCLASAVLYEAGDDATGERAVAQVVLNRVRHPAFPKTVCAVVFEGAERPTGCQFTFTCDGALLRHSFAAVAWDRARAIARAAMDGAVDASVGHATHYHANWVVPYWSASLDKVAAVGTHLFFRWSGWWGTPPAFVRAVSPDEPAIAQLSAYSPAHRLSLGLAPDPTITAAEILLADARAHPAQPIASDANAFLVTIDHAIPADTLPALAAASCGARSYCKFLAWTGKAQTPTKLPISTGQISTMAFSYLRDERLNFSKALWNCATYPRQARGECMKPQLLGDAPHEPPPEPEGHATTATPAPD